MKHVLKFAIDMGGITVCKMPVGSIFLDAQLQCDTIQAWFEVQFAQPLVTERTFTLVTTGSTFKGGRYLATIQMGAFVAHLYEVT